MMSMGLGISARLPPTGAAATKEERVATARIAVSFMMMLRIMKLGQRHISFEFSKWEVSAIIIS